ncbi:MAG: LPXTG cell wall anchor domain-containing protein [Oscillospiraceae bacterium]|nr:LPXTG cell wall anchor domain-containing protein [Oscillospiraceae bacterium]
MKKGHSLICAACAAILLSAVPSQAGAAEAEYVYGTMDIPYADFYRAELAGSTNVYDVDAVSSATASKWAMNEEGKLVEGTFNKANENGEGGQILGVTFPVAVKKDDLKLMGDSSYNFRETENRPDVYKTVQLDGSSVSFSAVHDETPVKLSGNASISANTAWGDYLVNISDKPDDMGAVYGAVIRTSDNKSYAMRHLENIWRGELAWSSGIRKTEPHGNALSYENYTGLIGSTITEITYITKNGYYTAETSLYVPVKFEGNVTVENTPVSSGKISVKTEGFPSDYRPEYSVRDLETTASGNTLSFGSALPGSYSLTVKDAGGKYADYSTSFTLTTDKIPAAYKDGKIIKAEGVSDEEYSNFISKLNSVKINDTEYNAGGKRGVKVLTEDGSIDMNAVSGETKLFDGKDRYAVSLTATGYDRSLDFVIENKPEEPAVTTTAASPKPSVSASSAASVQKTSSTPKTGDTSKAAAAASAMALAGLAAVLTSRKNKKK